MAGNGYCACKYTNPPDNPCDICKLEIMKNYLLFIREAAFMFVDVYMLARESKISMCVKCIEKYARDIELRRLQFEPYQIEK